MYSIPWHKRQKNILEKYLENNNIPNAILFSWEEWIWKFEIWRDFAKKILSQSVIPAEMGIHSESLFLKNFIEINKEKILIEDVREIIKEDAKTSIWSKKIFLIKNIENMNTNSSNAFLKALEESQNSIFICTTENKNLLLPTITSRFQTLEFLKLSDSEIKEFLKNEMKTRMLQRNIPIEDFVKFSFWKINLAKKFLDDENFLEDQKKFFEENKKFLEEISYSKIYKKSEFLFKNKEKIPNLIKNEIFFLENFLWKNWEWKKFFTEKFSEKKYLEIYENFLELKRWLKSNQNLKLVFDNFYIWMLINFEKIY